MPKRNSGDGSITERKDGRFQVALQVDGRRTILYAKSRGEAVAKLKELRRGADTDGALPANIALAALIELWIETDLPKWKPLYIRDVRHYTERIIIPALGNVRLNKLTPDRIQRFYNMLAKESTQKAAHTHRILRRALRVGVLWGYLPSNPLNRVTPPSHQSARPEMWTVEQTRAFLDSASDSWLGPFFETAIHTGCRPGEVFGLRWSDYDTKTLKIERTLQRVNGEVITVEPKTATSRRTLAVSPALASALRRQKAQQAEWQLRAGAEWAVTGFIFTTRTGTPLTPSIPCHALHRLSDPLGLPRLGLHKLRHLSASLAIQSGVPLPMVSRRLGHSSVAITAQVYSHALQGDEQAAEALNRALGTR